MLAGWYPVRVGHATWPGHSARPGATEMRNRPAARMAHVNTAARVLPGGSVPHDLAAAAVHRRPRVPQAFPYHPPGPLCDGNADPPRVPPSRPRRVLRDVLTRLRRGHQIAGRPPHRAAGGP